MQGCFSCSGVVVPKQRDKTVKEIIVSLATDYCANKTYMDDISLVAEPVQTYEYDDEGNLVSSTEAEGKTESETDDKDRLTEYTALNGVKYTLTYEDDSRNPQTITSDGVVTTHTYDAGNVTSTKVQKTGNSLYLESSANIFFICAAVSSISSNVLKSPRLTRIVPSACSPVRPMALSVEDTFCLCEAQAEPVEMQIPRSESR